MAGYLLVMSFYKTHERSLLSIWASKITRIYVPYIVALLLLAIFFDIEATRLDLVIHAFGVQLLLAPRIGIPIMTIWYVGLLLVYYLIFPILIKFVDSFFRDICYFGISVSRRVYDNDTLGIFRIPVFLLLFGIFGRYSLCEGEMFKGYFNNKVLFNGQVRVYVDRHLWVVHV
jgi:peptidoglycan/LPS O-acetylase OafA/YrhL